ncbi:MAG: PAS domain-containing protein [Verrucomicrobiales bacterium]|nr:PAS domain-containing protein [Verrucomicrobiales bacterium]
MTSSSTLVTNLAQFWSLAGTSGDLEFPAQIRFVVNHYDAEWRVLWVADDGRGSYLTASTQRLPIEAGEVVELQGYVRPGRQEVLWERSKLSVVGLATNRYVALTSSAAPEDTADLCLVTGEAWVEAQSDIDATHTKLGLVAGEWSGTAFVQLPPMAEVPQWKGARIRYRGLFSIKRGAPEKTVSYELWVSSPGDIEVLGWLDEEAHFAAPITAVDDLFAAPTNRMVRVAGLVHSQDVGRSLTLRDDTGQVLVLGAQSLPLTAGQRVEATGYPRVSGVGLELVGGIYREPVNPTTSPAGRRNGVVRKRRLADQVREMSQEEAVAGDPVVLRGVVTWSREGVRHFFFQDASGGVRVEMGPGDSAAVPSSGQSVWVEGVTGAGPMVPQVVGQRWWLEGNRILPRPRTLILEEALTGAPYGMWSEMRGYVRSVMREEGEDRVELVTPTGEFEARLPAEGELPEWSGAVVRLRGVCDLLLEARGPSGGARFLVPSRGQVEVLTAAPPDPFAGATVSASSLAQLRSQRGFGQRIKIAGEVLFQRPGRWLQVADGEESVKVLSRQEDLLHPGDRIELVGIPGWQAREAIMREGRFRKIGAATPSAPSSLESSARASPEWDGKLVRMSGRAVEFVRTERAVRVELQDEHGVFEALWEGTGAVVWDGATVEPGARLGVTGLFRQVRDEQGQLSHFEILLRQPSDLVELQPAPWWTPRRVAVVSGVMLTAVLGAMGWGLTLARSNRRLREAEMALRLTNDDLEERVKRRTAELEEEVRERKQSQDELSASHRRFEVVARVTFDVIWDWDLAEDGIWWNENFDLAFGSLPEDGRTRATAWRARLHPEDLGRVNESLKEALATGSSTWCIDYRFRKRDGTFAHVHDRAVVLRDAEGCARRVIGSMQDVSERREAEQALESIHRDLLRASRQAGMAEVATSVLHNVGNVLNSVNVSTQLLTDRVRNSSIGQLSRLVDLFEQHREDPGGFLTQDPRGRAVPAYLGQLSGELTRERQGLLRELDSLGRNIDHIREIVVMQQGYAKVAGVSETLPLAEVVEDALRINEGALVRHQVVAVRDYDPAVPKVTIDRHKVLQILVNLIRNAKYACDESGREDRRIDLRVRPAEEGRRVTIEVADNGVGIPAENLVRIFGHGFTTRKEGHGFGLHSAALAARELGGTLRVQSDGPGRGACFTLEVPVQGPDTVN